MKNNLQCSGAELLITLFDEIEETHPADSQVGEECKDPAQSSVGSTVEVERPKIGEEKYIIQESVEEIDEVGEKAKAKELDKENLRDIEAPVAASSNEHVHEVFDETSFIASGQGELWDKNSSRSSVASNQTEAPAASPAHRQQ